MKTSNYTAESKPSLSNFSRIYGEDLEEPLYEQLIPWFYQQKILPKKQVYGLVTSRKS